jgi:hypothetical protein
VENVPVATVIQLLIGDYLSGDEKYCGDKNAAREVTTRFCARTSMGKYFLV